MGRLQGANWRRAACSASVAALLALALLPAIATALPQEYLRDAPEAGAATDLSVTTTETLDDPELDVLPPQRALYALRRAIDTNTTLASWRKYDDNDAVCSTWEGVYCNRKGRVIGLNLKGMQLGGSLPDNATIWSSLPHLLFLNLQNTSLQGALPSALEHSTKLQAVALSNNNLTGRIPMSWSNLTSLASLDLSNNKLAGRLPRAMSNMTQLVMVDLSWNDLTPARGGVNVWQNMTSLQYLDLHGNDQLCSSDAAASFPLDACTAKREQNEEGTAYADAGVLYETRQLANANAAANQAPTATAADLLINAVTSGSGLGAAAVNLTKPADKDLSEAFFAGDPLTILPDGTVVPANNRVGAIAQPSSMAPADAAQANLQPGTKLVYVPGDDNVFGQFVGGVDPKPVPLPEGSDPTTVGDVPVPSTPTDPMGPGNLAGWGGGSGSGSGSLRPSTVVTVPGGQLVLDPTTGQLTDAATGQLLIGAAIDRSTGQLVSTYSGLPVPGVTYNFESGTLQSTTLPGLLPGPTPGDGTAAGSTGLSFDALTARVIDPATGLPIPGITDGAGSGTGAVAPSVDPGLVPGVTSGLGAAPDTAPSGSLLPGTGSLAPGGAPVGTLAPSVGPAGSLLPGGDSSVLAPGLAPSGSLLPTTGGAQPPSMGGVLGIAPSGGLAFPDGGTGAPAVAPSGQEVGGEGSLPVPGAPAAAPTADRETLFPGVEAPSVTPAEPAVPSEAQGPSGSRGDLDLTLDAPGPSAPLPLAQSPEGELPFRPIPEVDPAAPGPGPAASLEGDSTRGKEEEEQVDAAAGPSGDRGASILPDGAAAPDTAPSPDGEEDDLLTYYDDVVVTPFPGPDAPAPGPRPTIVPRPKPAPKPEEEEADDAQGPAPGPSRSMDFSAVDDDEEGAAPAAGLGPAPSKRQEGAPAPGPAAEEQLEEEGGDRDFEIAAEPGLAPQTQEVPGTRPSPPAPVPKKGQTKLEQVLTGVDAATFDEEEFCDKLVEMVGGGLRREDCRVTGVRDVTAQEVEDIKEGREGGSKRKLLAAVGRWLLQDTAGSQETVGVAIGNLLSSNAPTEVTNKLQDLYKQGELTALAQSLDYDVEDGTTRIDGELLPPLTPPPPPPVAPPPPPPAPVDRDIVLPQSEDIKPPQDDDEGVAAWVIAVAVIGGLLLLLLLALLLFCCCRRCRRSSSGGVEAGDARRQQFVTQPAPGSGNNSPGAGASRGFEPPAPVTAETNTSPYPPAEFYTNPGAGTREFTPSLGGQVVSPGRRHQRSLSRQSVVSDRSDTSVGSVLLLPNRLPGSRGGSAVNSPAGHNGEMVAVPRGHKGHKRSASFSEITAVAGPGADSDHNSSGGSTHRGAFTSVALVRNVQKEQPATTPRGTRLTAMFRGAGNPFVPPTPWDSPTASSTARSPQERARKGGVRGMIERISPLSPRSRGQQQQGSFSQTNSSREYYNQQLPLPTGTTSTQPPVPPVATRNVDTNDYMPASPYTPASDGSSGGSLLGANQDILQDVPASATPIYDSNDPPRGGTLNSGGAGGNPLYNDVMRSADNDGVQYGTAGGMAPYQGAGSEYGGSAILSSMHSQGGGASGAGANPLWDSNASGSHAGYGGSSGQDMQYGTSGLPAKSMELLPTIPSGSDTDTLSHTGGLTPPGAQTPTGMRTPTGPVPSGGAITPASPLTPAMASDPGSTPLAPGMSPSRVTLAPLGGQSSTLWGRSLMSDGDTMAADATGVLDADAAAAAAADATVDHHRSVSVLSGLSGSGMPSRIFAQEPSILDSRASGGDAQSGNGNPLFDSKSSTGQQ